MEDSVYLTVQPKLHAENILKCNAGVDVFFEFDELVIDFENGLKFRFDKVVTRMVIQACINKQKEPESWGCC